MTREEVMVCGREKFGAFIRREREAKEIGLREMAKMIRVSPTYRSKVERDEFPPPAAVPAGMSSMGGKRSFRPSNILTASADFHSSADQSQDHRDRRVLLLRHGGQRIPGASVDTRLAVGSTIRRRIPSTISTTR
jgi:hypothetical protein